MILRLLIKRAPLRHLFSSTSALVCEGFVEPSAAERSRNSSVGQTQITNVFEFNTQLKELINAGRLDAAHRVFDDMLRRDEISWTTLISGYDKASDHQEALNLFSRMSFEPNLKLDPFILSLGLKACGRCDNVAYGQLLHCVSVKTGLVSSVFVGSALLDMYTKTGRISDGCVVFNDMPERNVVSWTAIITGLVNGGYCKDGLLYFAEMVKNNEQMDSYTFSIALKACANLYDVNHGREIHTWTVKEGFDRISYVANNLAAMYNKCGKFDYGLSLFRKMRTPDVVSWTDIIKTYVHMDKRNDAIQEFIRMIKSGVAPNEYTFAAIISGCSILKWGEQLHSQVTKAGLVKALSVSNSLMTMYSKSGQLGSALMVFNAMGNKDIISWSTIIDGHCQGGCAEEAFELLSWMRREGPKPMEVALASVLSVCGTMAILEQGQQVHAYVLTIGLEHTARVQSALINMYSKCGSINEALEIFNSASNKDIVSWTAMINGYAEHGHSLAAIELFDRIPQVGLKPDSVTFIGILTACCHAGLVDLGHCYFGSMKSRYDINPSKEHYGCMIDLLCRAGKLDEAEEMINTMPMKQDDVVWSTLLRACRIHGDSERGRRAAEKILEFNPDCAGTHITLANTYSVTGKWREAAHIRMMIKTKGVIKEPGSSWIKGKDRLSMFVSGDRSHPEGECIYDILDLLTSEAGMVAQDVNDLLSIEQD